MRTWLIVNTVTSQLALLFMASSLLKHTEMEATINQRIIASPKLVANSEQLYP